MIESIDFPEQARGPVAGMFVTDYDGTLLDSQGGIPPANLRALAQLGEQNYLRIIATGRSLYSLWKSAQGELPVDFVVFSSGAGIIDYPTRRIVRKVLLEPSEVKRAIDLLRALNMDFMVHYPIPDNHRFRYYDTGAANPDFKRRCDVYEHYCSPLPDSALPFGPSTQLLAVDPLGIDSQAYRTVKNVLAEYSVVRTTSPMDGVSTWIEVFAAMVCKSSASEWIGAQFGVPVDDVLAVGNDYNDVDLLDWAGSSRVVANAAPAVRAGRACVPANSDAGVAVAIEQWLAQRGRV